MDRRRFLVTAAAVGLGAAKGGSSVADRAACSSLAQRMQPLEPAAQKIAGWATGSLT